LSWRGQRKRFARSGNSSLRAGSFNAWYNGSWGPQKGAQISSDSLTFARRLKSAGFTEAQAEALADANREMVVQDNATKDDIAMVKTEITALEQKLQAVIENQT